MCKKNFYTHDTSKLGIFIIDVVACTSGLVSNFLKCWLWKCRKQTNSEKTSSARQRPLVIEVGALSPHASFFPILLQDPNNRSLFLPYKNRSCVHWFPFSAEQCVHNLDHISKWRGPSNRGILACSIWLDDGALSRRWSCFNLTLWLLLLSCFVVLLYMIFSLISCLSFVLWLIVYIYI